MKDEKFIVKYYPDETDPMWTCEASCLIPWIFGHGVDIGCGARCVRSDIVRVDVDGKVKPDYVCSGDKLPFKDCEFDFVCSIHSFEHFPEANKTLSEWLRVVKVGGIVAIVHPDVLYTKTQKPVEENPSLKINPHNLHYHEHTADSFVKMLRRFKDLPFVTVDYGIACAEWSFYVILKKT
jgi:predicted SAM-dependent methyltransferase